MKIIDKALDRFADRLLARVDARWEIRELIQAATSSLTGITDKLAPPPSSPEPPKPNLRSV